MGQTAGIGAHDKHQLGAGLAVNFRYNFIFHTGGSNHGIPMQVNDNLDGSGFLQLCLDDIHRPIIGLIITGCINDFPAVYHTNSLLLQNFCEDITNIDHIMRRVFGTAALLVYIGFTGMGMKDHYRRFTGRRIFRNFQWICQHAGKVIGQPGHIGHVNSILSGIIATFTGNGQLFDGSTGGGFCGCVGGVHCFLYIVRQGKQAFGNQCTGGIGITAGIRICHLFRQCLGRKHFFHPHRIGLVF